MNLGAVGVTGPGAATRLASEADVVLAVGTRLVDLTTGSWASLAPEAQIVGLNVQPLDAAKRAALPLVADARVGLAALSAALKDFRTPSA
jgi:3D-(3,5/4)-trihydroxycyclohexane-1,2-dione acylhydrolase (decyclizing)